MSDFIPTAGQKNAIEAEDGTLLVAAGAGSGKTKVLTERLMRRICGDGGECFDVDRFVVITFTKAAAAELKGRILAELSKASAASPSNERLRRQLALIRKAPIGTIHHFCASILREYGQSAGISSDFKIISEERANEMKRTALERTLDESYRNISSYPGFNELVSLTVTSPQDGRLADLILTLYEKMQCHSHPSVWAETIVSQMRGGAADVNGNIWAKEATRHASSLASYWSGEMDRLADEISSDDTLKKAYYESFSETAASIRGFEACIARGWNEAYQYGNVVFPKLKSTKGYEDKEYVELLKSRRDCCKKTMKELKDIFYDTAENISLELNSAVPAMEALLSVVIRFTDAYSHDKRRGNYLDYSDLEHIAAALLIGPDGSSTPLAATVSARYAEVMVDEYQDVSRVQDDIFRAVSDNGRKLFMVGDVKQSIYRFRLADPEIFNEKYRDFAVYGKPLGKKGRKIFLRENFRSRRSVIDCVNAVFSVCMTDQLGDVAYDENARLVSGAQGFTGEDSIPELILVNRPDGKEGVPSTGKTETEAVFVAGKIREIVNSGLQISDGRGGTRSVCFSDIAILLRSANAVGESYRSALQKLGISATCGRGGEFFASREVSCVVSILKAMDNPHMDIPLITALTSPAFRFTADELSEIRAEDKDSDFFTALKKCAEKSDKCRGAIMLLSQLRNACPDLTAAETVQMIMEKTDLGIICSAMTDGTQRNANLMQMVSLAVKFEEDGLHGLHSFVRWLDERARKDSDSLSASGDASGVKIMSIHKSKGLEFPVVFLCNLDRRFNMSDRQETVLVHPELGLGPVVADHEKRITYPTLARKTISEKVKEETLSEEMRLLYVALTRPKEYLYMVAETKDSEKLVTDVKNKAPSFGGRVDPEALSGLKSPAEWLVAAALADGERNMVIRHVWPTEAVSGGNGAEQEISAPDEGIFEEIRSAVAFRYPYSAAQDLPSKITATGLGTLLHGGDDEEAAQLVSEQKHYFPKPDFSRQDRPATGAEKGIATHLALQYMNISGELTAENIRKEICRLEEQGFLSSRQAGAVNQRALLRLFSSPLGRRIKQADKVHREFRFSVLCDASELLLCARGEEILLQGVVDCCLEENGSLVIVDYKTDYVESEEDLDEKCRMYETQMKAYASAMERIFKMPVKECVLYFMGSSKLRSFVF